MHSYSYRDQSHRPPTGPGLDHKNDDSGSEGSKQTYELLRGRDRNSHNDDRRQAHTPIHRAGGSGRSSLRHSLARSRWQPPKGRGASLPVDETRKKGGVILARENNLSALAAQKRHGQKGGGKMNRQRRHSSDANNQRNRHGQHLMRPKMMIISPNEPNSAPGKQLTKNINGVEDIAKLNPDDPTHARRIKQRRRQVLFGKNTAGYEEYVKKVPHHQRQSRSMECPTTPDHMLDVPTKRWQGLMNAWRRALHKYDPPDLHLRQPTQDTITLAPRPCLTEEDRAQEEIARAKAAGLQVAFGSMNVGRETGMFSTAVAADDNTEEATGEMGGSGIIDVDKPREVPFDEEAAYRQQDTVYGEQSQAEGLFLEESGSDSDDELL